MSAPEQANASWAEAHIESGAAGPQPANSSDAGAAQQSWGTLPADKLVLVLLQSVCCCLPSARYLHA
jgi:hypothetical protein